MSDDRQRILQQCMSLKVGLAGTFGAGRNLRI
jgi:hypothetical protein